MGHLIMRLAHLLIKFGVLGKLRETGEGKMFSVCTDPYPQQNFRIAHILVEIAEFTPSIMNILRLRQKNIFQLGRGKTLIWG